MTNRLAIILGALVITALVLDAVFNDGTVTLFLLKKLTDLMDWMAFWR
ncbi:MAG: glyceraldehyde-3-phosphate dehydrogenase [Pseudomonadota bacterium]